LLASSLVIPKTPQALSGIVANAGACYDPGYPRSGSRHDRFPLLRRSEAIQSKVSDAALDRQGRFRRLAMAHEARLWAVLYYSFT
jgi:hypothetical protein